MQKKVTQNCCRLFSDNLIQFGRMNKYSFVHEVSPCHPCKYFDKEQFGNYPHSKQESNKNDSELISCLQVNSYDKNYP